MRRLALAAVVIAGLASGCTGSSSSAPPTPSPTVGTSLTPADCSSTHIRDKIRGFFVAWNARNGPELADLFAGDGELDFSTKMQNPLGASGNGFAIAVSRPKIVAFAVRQWRLGERLSYGKINVFAGSSVANTGAEVRHVVAHFADGTSQAFSEAKFHYDCRSQRVPHSVFVSASAAK